MAHNAWRDGRRAWERLEEWAARARSSGTSADGEAALDALDDVGQVRHLLDQAELAAVRLARRDRRSWTEIATRLGVTRQSAWERWRDVDDEDVAAEPPVTGERLPAQHEELGRVESLVLDRAARDLRRRGKVKVPDVTGLAFQAAVTVLAHAGLTADGLDQDGHSVAIDDMPGGIVTDQVPESGARIPVGGSVRLWLGHGRGGGAGVREPRRPPPSPSSLVEARPDPREESVSEAG